MAFKYNVINVNKLDRLLNHKQRGNYHTVVISDYNSIHFRVIDKCLNFHQP